MSSWWIDGWYALCDKRYAGPGYSALSDDEKVWLNVRALVDSTTNGGLISFFYNSDADTYQDCLSALDRLGANEVRTLVQRVAALFGEQIPQTVRERNEIINSWGDDDANKDALFDEVDSALYDRFETLESKLEGFVKEHALAA